MMCALLLAVSLAAQLIPPTPPALSGPTRDGATEKPGTAVIRGTVTSTDGGRALRRARIQITAGELSEPRSTTTSPKGTYEFKGLPAGRYTITVSRNGHLSLQHGQKRPGEPGRPLQIADGQVVEKVDFALTRSSVISGRITDETGSAFSGVQVFAMQPRYWWGRRVLVPMSTATYSDDTGQFRVVGLAPGDYVLMATIRETWRADGDSSPMFCYAQTYSGGTDSPGDALRIKVGSAQEVAAGDIGMVPVPAATLSGTAVGADGLSLAGGTVSLGREIMGPSGGSSWSFGGAAIAPDGTWKLKDVPPGDYLLSARGVGRDKPMETLTMTLAVSGDMHGIVLAADSGATLSGKIVSDDGSPLPESATRRVYKRTAVPGLRPDVVFASDTNGLVQADGSFKLTGVSGPNMILVSALPKGWAVKSIEIGDKDYVDSPIDLKAGRDVDGVRITISKSFPTVTGQITDDKGAPVEGTALLFPADPAKWLEAAGTLRASRPDQGGLFRFETVRPGEYLAVALEYVEEWQAKDPEFLAELKDSATKITLSPATEARLQLKVKKPAQ